jgi:hypothetical protein
MCEATQLAIQGGSGPTQALLAHLLRGWGREGLEGHLKKLQVLDVVVYYYYDTIGKTWATRYNFDDHRAITISF